MPSRASNKKGGSGGGVGCLVWIAILLLIALLYFLNRGKIEQTLKNTNFTDLLKHRLASSEPGRPTPIVSLRPAGSEGPAASPARGPSPRPQTSPERSGPAGRSPAPSERAASAAPTRAPSAKPGASPTAQATERPKSRATSLFFVRIDDDGTVIRQESKRSIPSSDSPLTDALNALLKGPTVDELNKGYLTLIPQGTKLLSVTMKASTAEVNFNEAFMFNSLGIEGYAGQLKQVVWTATAFATVQDVQIIIEGRKVEYLGGEGVYIGLPLSRNSF
jgi:spore germination protein GerM